MREYLTPFGLWDWFHGVHLGHESEPQESVGNEGALWRGLGLIEGLGGSYTVIGKNRVAMRSGRGIPVMVVG